MLAVVLLVPDRAGAVNYDFQPRNGTAPVANQTFTFQEPGGGTQKVTTDGSGKAIVDLKPGTTYRIGQDWGRGYWPSSASYTTPSTADRPITFQTTPVLPTGLWSPPGGVFTVAPVYQSFNVSDMKRTKDVATDSPTQAGLGPFINRADAAQLHEGNNDNTNRFNVQMAGIYGSIGLPVGPLASCDCMNFSHGLGLGGGFNHVNLDINSRSDQRASSTELGGDGGYFNVDYSATMLRRPQDKWWDRFGVRLNLAYMGGMADVTRHPKGSAGLSALNGRPTSEPTGDLDWSSWSAGLDFLYRICDCLYVFAGVKYREVYATLNTKDPSFVPGVGEVNRAIDQRYFNQNVLARVGLEAILAQPKGFPILGRIEGEYAPGGYGIMFKLGTGFDVIPGLRDRN
jgi:hypothetical protein